MKYVLLSALIVLSLVGMVNATPYLVCDPQTGVTSYKFTGDTFFTTKAAQPDGSLRYDLAGIPTGTHNIQTVACKSDPLWGEVCSTATPFSFTKPDLSINAPSGLKLAQ